MFNLEALLQVIAGGLRSGHAHDGGLEGISYERHLNVGALFALERVNEGPHSGI